MASRGQIGGNIMKLLEGCKLCPRQCGVNRENGMLGYCGVTAEVTIARAALHMWEEPCISGRNGSGTVFFSGCPMKCVFCQNTQIAIGTAGIKISIERLAEIFLELQKKGAHNINLVTPTHYVPQIVEALRLAKHNGLNIPIVYNTGSYEKVETLRLLEGLVDVWLPDCKYFDKELAARYSNAADYFEVANTAITEMVRQAGDPVFKDGLMKRGVIVRHMILPGQTRDSKRVIEELYRQYGDRIYISIMNQYTPLSQMEKFPEINRKVTKREYDKVVDYAISINVEKAFIQDGETAKESFIPDFDSRIGIFKQEE